MNESLTVHVPGMAFSESVFVGDDLIYLNTPEGLYQVRNRKVRALTRYTEGERDATICPRVIIPQVVPSALCPPFVLKGRLYNVYEDKKQEKSFLTIFSLEGELLQQVEIEPCFWVLASSEHIFCLRDDHINILDVEGNCIQQAQCGITRELVTCTYEDSIIFLENTALIRVFADGTSETICDLGKFQAFRRYYRMFSSNGRLYFQQSNLKKDSNGQKFRGSDFFIFEKAGETLSYVA